MKRDYPLVLAVLASLATGFVLLVACCAAGWPAVVAVVIGSAVVGMAARSAHSPKTHQTEVWYWDRAGDTSTPDDITARRVRRSRGGAR
ncbi:hypothetical protein [Nocardia paucivorans]|uniref:hypothetical protein n=1 Tax=Nocardia paucivorans TaxID=114259 RepID=UPI00030254C6|nr:hypothetical protein [Nocardia paucivorans]